MTQEKRDSSGMRQEGRSERFILEATESAAFRVMAGETPVMKCIPCVKLTHGAVTGGPFTVGEIVTGDTSGNTAQVIEVNSGYLIVSGDLTGWDTSTPDNISGGDSGATADISAAVAGVGYIEYSTSPPSEIEAGRELYSDSGIGAISSPLGRECGNVNKLKFRAVNGPVVFEVNV